MQDLDLSFLPKVNASLNAMAVVLILVGVGFIKRKNIAAHRATMLTAFATSGLFLVFYITHYIWRAQVKGGVHTKYNGPMPILYYLMLVSHILLAMAVPVLAIWLIVLGFKRRDALHRRIAKIAVPVWLYVSVTGVLIYFILYHLNPPAAS